MHFCASTTPSLLDRDLTSTTIILVERILTSATWSKEEDGEKKRVSNLNRSRVRWKLYKFRGALSNFPPKFLLGNLLILIKKKLRDLI